MDLQTNPSELARVLSGWTDGGHGTLPQRLAYGLRCAIGSGLINDGAKLPPERDLARALAVSRSTITTALDLLRDEGLVESRQGSGTLVRGPSQRRVGTARIAGTLGGATGIDLALGTPPDPSHLPPITIDVAELICSRIGSGLVPLGLPVLREALAERHMQTGLITDPTQIHVTAGAHQAIALTLTAVAGPGDLIAAEDPNYSGLFDILEGIGARPLILESDEDGVRPASLERALQTGVSAVYLQTGPQNPTGRVPSPERMQSLAAVLDKHRAFVVEDLTLADLTFGGRPRPELAELCRRAVVVTTGSFSKVGWAGLRIGWLRAPAPFVERTMHIKLARDLGASAPSQLMAAALVPSLDGLAAQRQATLKAATGAALAQLAAELPSWEVEAPRGGSVLWVKLPVSDSGPFVALAGRHGVHVAPGSAAMAGRGQSPHIRVCVDRPRPLVEAGLQRLGHAWSEIEAPRARPILT
ncbi:MAG TPA: PLP-dependent aminotransferase family protein [Sporichthya sp.]|nr:PLP-dependent aminotransferase family protein [Sporichthya sp.]